MDRLTIIKVGGKVVEEEESLNALLEQFNRVSGNKILVHGGGSAATNFANRLGLQTQLVEGRRITDEAMLEVVTMVYGGLINKRIVAKLQARGCNAIGLTGADLDLIRAVKRPVKEIDYGYVGDIEDVNSRDLRILIEENAVPVIAPLTHDGQGNILNTNADTIASEVAIELSNYYSVYLFYCFDKKGVLSDPNDENSIIYDLDPALFQKYQQEGIISEGMIPKLETGFRAKRNGTREVLITNPNNISSGRGTRLILNV